MNNKPTTAELLETIANNWNSFSKEEQEYVANLFTENSATKILKEIERLREKYENKTN